MFEIDLPTDINNIIYINLALLFLVSYFYSFVTDGQVTIRYIDEYEGLRPGSNQTNIFNYTMNEKYSFQNTYRPYKKELNKVVIRNTYIMFYTYVLVIPLINIIYGIWCYRRGLLILPKSLNKSIS